MFWSKLDFFTQFFFASSNPKNQKFRKTVQFLKNPNKPLTFQQSTNNTTRQDYERCKKLNTATKKRRRMMKKKIKLIYLWNDTEAITECHLHTSLSINGKKVIVTKLMLLMFCGCQYVSSYFHHFVMWFENFSSTFEELLQFVFQSKLFKKV